MRNSKLYLAHPLISRAYVRNWEKGFEERTGIELVNPFYDARERKEIEALDRGERKRYEDIDPFSIVNGDLKSIAEAEGTVAILDTDVTIGTIMEIVYTYNANKPVYCIVTNGWAKHPWIIFHATKIFASEKEFEDYMMEV